MTLVRTTGQGSGETFARAALGFLELGLGRIDAAIGELEAVERIVTTCGMEEPTLIPWAPDLIEAYMRADRREDAARVLAVLARQAGRSGTRWAAAATARCEGIVADEDFDERFAEAVALHDLVPLPFERARTLLAWGMRLHRARRRVEARERLRSAAAIFEELGAAPWAALAHAELRAAGGRRRETLGDVLSAQEERVAQAAARGATTREIAAELFLAPKTIEFHLGRIYRKLGVRSRAGLVAVLSERQPGPAA
jgi:DNA-binding CsgD family transcriptional regulator